MLWLKPVQLGESAVVSAAFPPGSSGTERLLHVPRPSTKSSQLMGTSTPVLSVPSVPRYEQLTGTPGSTATAATGILPELAEALTVQTKQAHEIPLSWVSAC